MPEYPFFTAKSKNRLLKEDPINPKRLKKKKNYNKFMDLEKEQTIYEINPQTSMKSKNIQNKV